MTERAERIFDHYRRMTLDQGLSAARYHRLCRVLNCTVDELAALCCVTEKRMKYWLKTGAIPPYVALTLRVIESAWVQLRTGLAQKPIIPNL